MRAQCLAKADSLHGHQVDEVFCGFRRCWPDLLYSRMSIPDMSTQRSSLMEASSGMKLGTDISHV